MNLTHKQINYTNILSEIHTGAGLISVVVHHQLYTFVAHLDNTSTAESGIICPSGCDLDLWLLTQKQSEVSTEVIPGLHVYNVWSLWVRRTWVITGKPKVKSHGETDVRTVPWHSMLHLETDGVYQQAPLPPRAQNITHHFDWSSTHLTPSIPKTSMNISHKLYTI